MVTKLDATQYTLPSLTKTLYVDKRRTDVYVEDGALNTPFKTIMGAVNKVIANGDNSQALPYTIRVATAVYTENVVLEDSHLVSLIIIGEGSRLQTQINPASGYSLQSMANNANFYDLHMENIQFTKPTMMVGSANNNYFGYNFFFVNCYWPDTALATFKNMTYPSFMGDICKFSGGVVFSNITQASINGIGGFKTSSGLTIETDQTANKPYLMTTGTMVLACQCRTPNVTWSLLNITTMTGTALQIRAVRHGSSGETIPLNAQILAYHSSLIGNYVNNGTLTLYNSQVSGTLSGNAPVLYQSANQVKNTPAGTVSATTVQAAIDELDSEKVAKNSISGTFITADVPPKTITVVNGQITGIA
jgi:hypothetical protein